MRAWLLDKAGDLSRLRVGEAPPPQPGAGEALLRVRFAALNPADRYLAEGLYPAKPPFPHILGRDGMGEVARLGPGVSGVDVGSIRLILRGEAGVTRRGTFAEYCVVPADSLVEPPPGWTPEQAGCAALAYLTAYQALTLWGPLRASVVLVTGASGGVGVAAVQLARALGHTVLALSRDPEKRERLKGQGANAAFSPEEGRWPLSVKEFLDGGGVDLAVDNVGGRYFNELLGTLAEGGRVSCVGRLAGPVPSFNTASLLFRRLRLGGVSVGAYRPSESRAAFNEVLALLGRGGFSPLVDSVWDFDRLPEAFSRLAAGPMGKVVLRVR